MSLSSQEPSPKKSRTEERFFILPFRKLYLRRITGVLNDPALRFLFSATRLVLDYFDDLEPNRCHCGDSVHTPGRRAPDKPCRTRSCENLIHGYCTESKIQCFGCVTSAIMERCGDCCEWDLLNGFTNCTLCDKVDLFSSEMSQPRLLLCFFSEMCCLCVEYPRL